MTRRFHSYAEIVCRGEFYAKLTKRNISMEYEYKIIPDLDVRGFP